MKLSTVLLTSAAFVGSASAQLVTSTLPWLNGDTVIVSGTTDALGETAFLTLETLTGAATATALVTGVLTTTTALTTPLTTALTTSRTTTARTRTTTTARTAKTTAATATTTAAAVVPTEDNNGPTAALYTTNVVGVLATFQSGTQMKYSQWSALVEPSLSAAYYATAKSSASTRISSFLPPALVSSSLALAAVGGLVGFAQVLL